MNKRTLVAILPAVLLAAGCYPMEEHTAHFERTWPAADIKRLEVREVSGTINIDGDSPNEVRMVAQVRARGVRPDPSAENQGYFRSELEDGTLLLRTRDSRNDHFFFGPDIRVDYDLHVPPQVALELRTVNGRIETHAIAGEVSATTVNGAVDLETTGSNEMEANTVNGRVKARFLNDFHGARLRAVNGRITAVLPPTASFYGDFTQVNGDFEAAFPLNIHSNPGSRRVSGDVNGGRYPLRITTVNGDIKIDNAPAAPPAPAAPSAPAAHSAPAAPPAPPAAPAPRT